MPTPINRDPMHPSDVTLSRSQCRPIAGTYVRVCGEPPVAATGCRPSEAMHQRCLSAAAGRCLCQDQGARSPGLSQGSTSKRCHAAEHSCFNNRAGQGLQADQAQFKAGTPQDRSWLDEKGESVSITAHLQPPVKQPTWSLLDIAAPRTLARMAERRQKGTVRSGSATIILVLH